MKKILTLAAIAVLAMQAAQASVYQIQSPSEMKWLATKIGGQHDGTIAVRSGTVEFAGDTIKAAKFEIDMKSIRVLDIKDPKYNADLTTHLKSDDFFSSDKFSTGTFELKKATARKDGMHDIEGVLTLKGKSEKVSFPAKIERNGDKITLQAKAKLDRTLWDIRYKSAKFFPNLGDKIIHDEFTVEFNLQGAASSETEAKPNKPLKKKS